MLFDQIEGVEAGHAWRIVVPTDPIIRESVRKMI